MTARLGEMPEAEVLAAHSPVHYIHSIQDRLFVGSDSLTRELKQRGLDLLFPLLLYLSRAYSLSSCDLVHMGGSKAGKDVLPSCDYQHPTRIEYPQDNY